MIYAFGAAKGLVFLSFCVEESLTNLRRIYHVNITRKRDRIMSSSSLACKVIDFGGFHQASHFMAPEQGSRAYNVLP
jgi:hypothetical protein